jgi:hypothetical protein
MKKEDRNSNTSEIASALGKLGGQKTAQRGPEYYAQIQAMRKVRSGGRPKLPPQAAYEGVIKIGTIEIPCAVLEDGTRILNQAGFLRAIGRARSPKAGKGVLSTIDNLPFFLQAEALQPFISDELRESTKPIFYFPIKTVEQGIPEPPYRFPRPEAVGYNAEVLPQVCEVYLKFRDQSLKERKEIPGRYKHIFEACDILMRGLAHVGIIALVDEATGFQAIRDRNALQAILDKFLRKELAAWAKRFPNEFYQELFRLRGWQWKGMKVNRPQAVAGYTKDFVYDRLVPGIREELERLNPKDERGRRKHRHHQWLTDDVGHPALAQHLYAVIGLMRASTSWEQFTEMMDKAFPKKGTTLFLPIAEPVN